MKSTIVILWAVVLLGLSGCDLFKKEEDNSKPPLSTDAVVLTAENDFVVFTRTALAGVTKNGVFSVKVTLEAKEALELLGISEQIPDGFQVISGDTTDFLANAGAGDVLELNYTIKAGDESGDFSLTGFSRAKPLGGSDSEQLELISPLEVR